MMGSPLAAATVLKWYSSSAAVGTYTMAGSTISPLAPKRSASRAKLAAVAVVNYETPTMTGALPSVTSTAAFRTFRFLLGVERVALAHCPHQDQAVNPIFDHGLLHPRRLRQ